MRRLLLLALLAGCAAHRRGHEEAAGVAMRPIEAVLAAHNDSLMAVPGVVGTAIGRCDGAPCIRVFLAHEDARSRRGIPAHLEGYPVHVEVTGPIRPRSE